MIKFKTLIVALFLVTLFSISCKKDQSNSKDLQPKVDRAMIAKQISLHSKGLSEVISSYKKSKSFLKLASNTPISDIHPSVDAVQAAYLEADNSLQDFFHQNNLTEYSALINLYANNPNQIKIPTSSLQDKNLTYSQTFYNLANQIINVDGSDSIEIQQQIDKILNSNNFLGLSDIEQTILIVGGETYIDSFNHWSTNNNWQGILAIIERNSDKLSSKKIAGTAGGSWRPSRWRTYAKADAIGGVAGAIGGAIGGAAVGAIFGGIGAAPGALQGAVRGGIGGAVAASVGKALMELFPNASIVDRPSIIDNTKIVNGIEVPEAWDLIPVNKL